MKNNELKFLANLAKQRLMNKDYKESKPYNNSKISSYFIQNAKALKRLKAETNYVIIKNKEDEVFINKVKEILDNECYNPLGQLCDMDYFMTLDKFEKEFYILNLSEKYTRVKDQLLCS